MGSVRWGPLASSNRSASPHALGRMQWKTVSVRTDHRREARARGRVSVRIGAGRSCHGEIWRELFLPPKKKRGQDDFRKNSDKVDPRDIA